MATLEISQFIRPDLVVELKATDGFAALDEIMQAVTAAGLLNDPKLFYEKLLERERDSSTSLGQGIALPHTRMNDLDEVFIAVGRSKGGLDYAGCVDGAPVHLVFMVGATSDQSRYLKIVSRITWLVRNDDLRQQLFSAPDSIALHRLLSQY